MKVWIVSGAGNRFAVVDLFREPAPSEPAALARRLCNTPPAGAPALDGLLLVGPPGPAGRTCIARMVLYNADGSRALTCGNGLRCTARLLCEWGRVAGDAFAIETDVGAVETSVRRDGESVHDVRVCMGAVRILDRALLLRVPAEPGERSSIELAAGRLDVGNPHVVIEVEDERSVPVALWGPWIERDARFRQGTNVGFVAERDGRPHLRVWERGVGETEACGSGACAAGAWLVSRGRAAWPLEIELPGGRLTVDADVRGGVWLAGPAETLGVFETETEAALGAAD